jgi:molybdate/tungstate transport system substrate-binding protein
MLKKLAIGIFLFTSSAVAGELIVFHAGSLSVPFEKMEKKFKKLHPEIKIIREASGSVQAIRKVVDLKRKCDVVASADYSLIPKMMFPKFANQVKVFAANELVLCYTEKSKFSQKVNSKNWFKVLSSKGVKWGFSNPNLDPCGYRTLMTIALAQNYYGKPIFNQIFNKKINLKLKESGKELIIEVPERLRISSNKIFVRPKAVALLGLLESGAIDYAFEYKSVALQHGLKFVELPKEINLSELKYKNFYSRVKVRLGSGKIIEGKPIAYGIAVVKGAPHPKEAQLWEEFVTSKDGAKILEECWQTPIYPAKVIRK